MTTTDPTHTRSHNSGVADGDADRHEPRVPNADAQAVLDYLERVGDATLEGLASRAGLPEAELKNILNDLQERDLVDATTGFRVVTVSRTDRDRDRDVRTDGGPLRAVADALSHGQTASVDLSSSEVWEIIAVRQRRRLIRLLAVLYDEYDDSYLEVRNVAAVLTTTTTGMRVSESRHADQHSIYVSLQQTHLPLLAEHGIIEYYDRVEKVKPTEEAVELARVQEWVVRACDPTSMEGSP